MQSSPFGRSVSFVETLLDLLRYASDVTERVSLRGPRSPTTGPREIADNE